MKKTLCFILAALMLLCFVSCGNTNTVNISGDEGEEELDYTFEVNNATFEYEITELNTIRIIGYTGSYDIHTVEIPAEMEGIVVAEIGPKAFYYANNISAVTIPDSVHTIGDWAFAGCTYLADIKIPASVTTIGEGAFYKCVGLKAQTLPEALTAISANLFYGCTALESIDIPAAVTELGDCAFWGCTALAKVNGMEGVATVGEYVFHECTKLGAIVIPR